MAIGKEFKEFISRGNVIDLAVGVIIGGAFGKIVNSVVNDLLLPPIGLMLKGVDFKDMKWAIGGEGETTVYLSYGNFLQNVVEFLLVATAIFLLVKAINTARRKQEKAPSAPPAPPAPTREAVLLTEIRDLLQQKA